MDAIRLLVVDLAGTRLTPDERAFLAERRPWGVCLFGRNIGDRFAVAELVAELREVVGSELLVTIDQEGGGVLRIPDLPYPPSAMALGAADDPELTRRVAAATGRGLRALGINVDFAPVADVNVNAANPVIADRSFGADAQTVASHVAAFVRGLQAEGVAATVKHFPGHGDTSVDSHLALPRLERSLAELERTELPPFRAAVAVGAAAVMTAHILLPGIEPELPATLSRRLMTDLLRMELGFEGVTFSDALDMRAVADRWTPAEAAVMAHGAGVDLPVHIGPVSEHEGILDTLERARREGRLDPGELAAAERRVARLAQSFPPRPDPTAAWREGDEELLAEAARRALVALGELPRLRPGTRVGLVAADAVQQGAATQSTLRPADDFAEALAQEGIRLERLDYQPEEPRASTAAARELARRSEVAIFASTGRTGLRPGERELALALREGAGSFLHVALWNPYSVRELPGPALLTFGFRRASARAAVEALLTGRAAGTLPVPLEPA